MSVVLDKELPQFLRICEHTRRQCATGEVKESVSSALPSPVSGGIQKWKIDARSNLPGRSERRQHLH